MDGYRPSVPQLPIPLQQQVSITAPPGAAGDTNSGHIRSMTPQRFNGGASPMPHSRPAPGSPMPLSPMPQRPISREELPRSNSFLMSPSAQGAVTILSGPGFPSQPPGMPQGSHPMPFAGAAQPTFPASANALRPTMALPAVAAPVVASQPPPLAGPGSAFQSSMLPAMCGAPGSPPPRATVGIMGPCAALAGGPLAMPPQKPMCVAPDPTDPLTIRVQKEWEEVSTVADGILRGPVDHLLQEPERARCRLCGQSLTGNLFVDQNIVGNHRLVQCMDFAWTVCERFCRDKGEMQRRALAKRRHLEEVQGLAGQLRAELPSQVHGYVMRTLNEPREKLCRLRQQLEDLNAVDGLGLGWSQASVSQAELEEAANSQPMDMLWYRFRESMERRVARLAVQHSGNEAAGSAPSSPVKSLGKENRIQGNTPSPPRLLRSMQSPSPSLQPGSICAQELHMPAATVGIDTSGDGRPNYLVSGMDRNRDGIPDALQMQARPMPTATVGLDTSGDGRPNYLVSGMDRNRDGIPDAMQMQARPMPTATVGIDTSGDGRPNYIVNGMDRNRDGMPDAMRMQARPMPTATVGIDTSGDGRPNYLVSGMDRNRDGIPDAMQMQARPMPTATVGIDTSGDGRPNYLVSGMDRNRDGMPDAMRMQARPMPTATVGIDISGDGRPNYLVSGMDRNRDGIPDAMQMQAGPVGAAMMGIDTTGDGRPNYAVSGGLSGQNFSYDFQSQSYAMVP